MNRAAPAHTPATPFTDVARLSFNQATAERASLPDVIESCARHAVPRGNGTTHRYGECANPTAPRSTWLVADAKRTLNVIDTGTASEHTATRSAHTKRVSS